MKCRRLLVWEAVRKLTAYRTRSFSRQKQDAQSEVVPIQEGGRAYGLDEQSLDKAPDD
jgi:hypothetical protein